MSKVVSFRDIMICEEVKERGIKNEIQLLNIENDDLMEKILRAIGMDVDYPVLYIPTKHRDMQGKVAVGFQCVGEISINREFVNSYLCSPEERIVAASYSDRSLAMEMQQLTAGSISRTILQDDDRLGGDDEFDPAYIEPDYMEVAAQIKMLEELRDTIRGTPYNEAGDLKCFHEYK